MSTLYALSINTGRSHALLFSRVVDRTGTISECGTRRGCAAGDSHLTTSEAARAVECGLCRRILRQRAAKARGGR